MLELDLTDVSPFVILVNSVKRVHSPSMPVVVLTHVPNRYLWELARSNGAYACLWKPQATGDMLAMTILRALAHIPPKKKERHLPRFSFE